MVIRTVRLMSDRHYGRRLPRHAGRMIDAVLLKHVLELRHPLHGLFRSLEIGGQRAPLGSAPALNAATVATARTFCDSTPGSRRVKVCGKLDRVRASTQRFVLILPTGEEAQGILREGDICDFQGLLAKPIVVFGKAVYRPSGRLLRIDADKIETGSDADWFFGKIPAGIPAQPGATKNHTASGRGGVNAIFGKWPGSETDEEVAQALRRLS